MSQEPATPRGPCFACKGSLLAVDRFCPRCGADHRWARGGPIPTRIPRSLDVEQFQDEGDRFASSTLALAAPVQAAVRYYLRRVAEPEYRHQLLGSSLKVSRTQFPRVDRLARFCERILHTAPVEVYVTSGAEAGAFSFGSGSTDVVVLNGLLVDSLEDDELLFFLGSQLGHVKADHVLYLTVAKALTTALKGIPALGSPLSGMASYLLIPWERQAMLTSDRAGLLCCQSLAAAASCILKLYLGSGALVSKMNLTEFLAQSKSLEQKGDWGDTWKNSPALLRRIRELEAFHDGTAWDHIFDGAWDPEAPRFRCLFCPGGATPAGAAVPLASLACTSCKRNLMVEEIPCPHCLAILPVGDRATLGNLICDSCGRSYLADATPAVFTGDSADPAVRELSAYHRLGIHPTAGPVEIRTAFRERIAPLEEAVAGLSKADPVTEKIRLFAAYNTLMDAPRRADHDRALGRAHELAKRREPGRRAGWSLCTACRSPLSGPWCGTCGQKAPTGEEADGTGLAPELLAELRRMAGADLGELIEDPTGIFDFAFHYRRRSLFFKRAARLDRPTPIRNLLRGAADVAAAQGFAASPEFFAVLDGPGLDRELYHRLTLEKPTRTGEARSRVSVLVPGEGGRGLVVVAQARKGLEDKPFAGLAEWIGATLGVKPPAREGGT